MSDLSLVDPDPPDAVPVGVTAPPFDATAAMDGGSVAPKSILQSPFFWATLAGLMLIPLMRPFLRFEPPPPPVLSQLPAFTLTSSAGDAFGSTDLAGQVYVASFFFSRCPSICPLLTAAMSSLDQRFAEEGVDGVHLVSITVDPEHDTPERLKEYAAAHDIDTDRWTLLTGDPESVRSLVVDGFKTAVGGPAAAAEGELVDIAHSGKLVLVDHRGGIRGYYDADALGLDEIFHRSRHVLDSI